MDSLLADVRYALRWLARSPGFTITAVASLAIGIGFNSALFTLVDAALFRPLPIERPDRVVDVYSNRPSEGFEYMTSSYPDYLDLKARNQVFTGLAGYSPSLDAVKLGDHSRLALGEVVTGNYFQVLGVRAAMGRTLAPEDDRPGAPRVAVLSYRAWQQTFGGSSSVLGTTIRIHGQPYSIVGVVDRAFTGLVPMVQPELWTTTAWVEEVQPAGVQSSTPSPGKTHLERRGQRWMFLKGRLKDGETAAQAQANLSVIMDQLRAAYPDADKERRALVVEGVHIHPAADRALRPAAIGLGIVVGLVLLVACANVASMLLARASGRQREIGIRIAIGASRGRLIRQMLTEGAVLAALGATAGVAVAWALVRSADAIRLPLSVPLSFALHLDARVLVFTMIVSVTAGLLAALAPAVRASRPNVVSELKGDAAGASVGRRRWTLRDGLVALQIAVTFVLLVAAGLLTRSILAAQRIDLGFRPEGLAAISTELKLIGYDEPRAKQFYDRALERIRAIPGVTSATLTARAPLALDRSGTGLYFADRPGDDKGVVVDETSVGREYFDTLGVRIVDGRGFTTADTPDSPKVAVVNEAFAGKFFPHERVVGRQFHTRGADGPLYQIVGVVADYKVNSPGEPPTPYVHFDAAQEPDTGEMILARTRGSASDLLGAMRRELQALEPNIVFIDDQTMTSQVEVPLMPARLAAIAVATVGIVAMLLAAIGLYGVIAYSVARRTREIGIRMALGAEPASVLALVMRQGFAVVAAGGLVGLVLAAGAARAMAQALYTVGAGDPIAWGAAVGVVVAASAAANVVPAARAARVAPSTALRTE